MKRPSKWLKSLLALAAVAAFAWVLVWLLRTAGRGPAVGQRVPSTASPTLGEVATAVSTSPAETEVTRTATIESQGMVRILYAVQPSRGAVTLWTLDLTPKREVAAERELRTSPIPVEWLRPYEVSISPDGRYVALNLRGGAENLDTEVWTVGLGSGAVIQLPSLHHSGLIFMDWIPSTNRILARDLDGGWIALLDPDGSNVQELPYHYFQDGAVSPDGQRFVLSALEETTFWLMNVDGSLIEKIPIPDKKWPGSGGAPYGLAWSPNGEELAYFDNLVDEMSQIRVIDIDRGNLKYLSSDDAHNLYPVWSGDGTALAYIREPSSGIIHWDGGDPTKWNSSVWIAEVETGRYSELVPSEGRACWSAAWLPDGSGIVFVSNRAGQSDVWVVNRDGTGLRPLTDQGDIVVLDVAIRPTDVPSPMPAERDTPTPPPENTEIPLALPAPLPAGAIVFPVGHTGDDSTFKVLRYDPAMDVLTEENVSSPLGNLRLSVGEFSVSPDRRFVAINLVYADEPGGEAYLVSVDGTFTFLRTGEYEGGRFLAWIPGTDKILVGFRPVAGAAIVNLQGEDFVPLLGSLVYSGAASPDGEWLVLSSAGDPECPDARQECFYFVKPDGLEGRFTSIPDKAWGGVTPPEITWSPDGKRIAYVDSFYEGWFQVRTVDAEGNNLQKLGPEKMECYSPAWSPDSVYLVYACEESEAGFYRYRDRTAWVSGIWLANVASGEVRQIVAAEGRAAWWPTWLPDGSGIVFVSNRGGGNDLWFVRPDGTGLRQLTFDGQIAD